MTRETSTRGTTWASWMDDRTTTAYSPRTHHLVPRAPVAPKQRATTATVAQREQQTQLRMEPLPPASSRSDEAGLMWLDDADLLSVSEPSFTAADSGNGSIVAKCLLPGIGLFGAVLFGHIILASAAQITPATGTPRTDPPPSAAAKSTATSTEHGNNAQSDAAQPGAAQPGAAYSRDALTSDARSGDVNHAQLAAAQSGDANPAQSGAAQSGAAQPARSGEVQPTHSRDARSHDAHASDARAGDANHAQLAVAQSGNANPAQAGAAQAGAAQPPRSGDVQPARAGDARSGDARAGDANPALAGGASHASDGSREERGGRSRRQHYDEGARGSGAGVTAVSTSGESRAQERAVTGSVAQQPGLLRINSRPWALVTLDGAALGNTPLFDVQVAPGEHTLRLDNPDFQISKTIHLDVAPGETVTRVVSLQD